MTTKSVLVTGGGSGIGRAVTQRFVDGGWHALALDVNADALANSWGSHSGVSTAVADITDEAAVAAVLAASGLDTLDCVVNVAGIYPMQSFRDFDVSLYRKVFDINVLGTLATIHAALPYLDKADTATVVNFASMGAYQGATSNLAVYRASKAAIVSLTRSLASELAPGIRVNGIAPGAIETEGTAGSAHTAELAKQIPLGRIGTPADMAEWAWALGGESALPFATGETVIVSGGGFMR